MVTFFFAGGFYFFEHVVLVGGGVVMGVWDVGVEDLGISFQFVFLCPWWLLMTLNLLLSLIVPLYAI